MASQQMSQILHGQCYQVSTSVVIFPHSFAQFGVYGTVQRYDSLVLQLLLLDNIACGIELTQTIFMQSHTIGGVDRY